MRGTLRYRRWALLGILAALALVAPAVAAEIGGGEVYRLEKGQVIEDDLVVTASEIYIDGTVQGDLVAAASYIEINGVVEGDLIAAGADLRINGTVADDARVAGAGVTVGGQIGDDLFAAAGGSEGPVPVSQMAGRQVQQGLRLEPGSKVGGSVYLGAGDAELAGEVGENLSGGAGRLTLLGHVKGDADVDVSTLRVADGARVDGTLTYSTPVEGAVPSGAAGNVRYEAPPPQPANQGANPFWAALRLVLTLAGFALLGWLALRFTPRLLGQPAEAIAANPGRAGLYGLVAAVVLFVIPILSVAVFAAIIVFWGWLPGLMFGLFLTAALVLVWTLSPLITGLWLGEAILKAAGRQSSRLIALLVGIAVIVLLGAVPVLGWLVYLLSFLLAVGGELASRRGPTVDMPAPIPAMA